MSKMKLFLSAAVALLVLRADPGISVCEPQGNGTDVQLTLNCSTLNPVVSYRVNTSVLREYYFYGSVAVEYTCTNSSNIVVAEGVALNHAFATATSSHIEPTLASGVDCTFSGCYASTVSPNNYRHMTTLAIKPTPCTVDIDECSRGLHNCNEKAVCRNTRTSYTCECNFGYEGDGLNCTNIDECLIGADNCSDNAVCADTVGGYNCTCRGGFEGDGFTCSNIDECLTGANNCSDSAVCSDTVGGHNCTCRSGFEGDGFTCSNIDECVIAADNCSVNAVCTDTVGGYNCTCKNGFEGDGFTCSNINECLIGANICSDSATCTDTVGGYNCTCRSGFDGDGFTCSNIKECLIGADNCNNNATCIDTLDIDECLIEADNNCSVNAVCTDTVGGYNCTCTTGYEGDGLTCSNVDECERQGNSLLCDTNAECIDTEGSYVCNCNHGYNGDGFACTNINECRVDRHNCDPNAECVDTDGGYNCTCMVGYEGSGHTCNNIDECLVGNHTCGVGAECVDTIGGYNCSCRDSYYWDGYACQLPEDTQQSKVAIAAALAVPTAAGIVAVLILVLAVIWRRVYKCDAKTFPLEITFKDKIDLDFFPIDLKASPNFELGSVVSLFDALRQPIPTGTVFKESPSEGSQKKLGAVAHWNSIDTGRNDCARGETVVGIPARKKEFQKFSVTDDVCEKGNQQRSLQELCDSESGTPPSKPPRTGTVPSAYPTHRRVTLSRSYPTQQPDSLPRSDQQLTSTPPRTHPIQQQASQLSRSDPDQLSKTVTSLQSRPNRLSLPTKCDCQIAGENPCSPTFTSFRFQTLLRFPIDDSGFYQDSEGYIKNSSKSGSEMNSGNVTPSLKHRNSEIMSKMGLQYDINTCDHVNSPSTKKLPIERTRYTSDGEEGYMETKLSQISTV